MINQLPVFGNVMEADVIQQPPALTDQFKQTLARAVILLMRFEMRSELIDAFG